MISSFFWSETSRGILIHAFSRFGRRLNAVFYYLVLWRIFAHISRFFSPPAALRGPSGGPATDAETLMPWYVGCVCNLPNSLGLGKHVNIIMKPTNSPTQGQPNARKIRLKSGILGPTFFPQQIIFRGLELFLCRKQTLNSSYLSALNSYPQNRDYTDKLLYHQALN